MTVWASLRHVRGSADVSAPTGDGEIESTGFGPSLGASWENAGGYYAEGRVSLILYESDVRTDGRGLLKEGVGRRSIPSEQRGDGACRLLTISL